MTGPSPAEIPALEEGSRAAPGDAALLLRLGAAYLEDARPAEARQSLEAAAERAPDNALVHFYLGVAYEEMEMWDEAHGAYESVLAASPPQRLRGPAQRRLPLLRRKALEAEIRTTLAQEAALADRPPADATVAVYPFRFTGADPELAPLGTALAELVVSDLSKVERITVLERLRVRLLLDEMRLTEEGYVDPATAARSGRMLGAGQVVQGNIDGAEERVEILAGVVRVRTADSPSPVSEADALQNFLDLQKRVVLSLFASMGVELTPAERERVLERPTESLRALILYGRALQAEDRGEFATAAGFYQQALEEDPGFDEAREGQGRATTMAHAGTEPPGRLAVMAHGELPILDGVASATPDFGALQGMIPAPEIRDPLAEVLGREGLSPSPAIIEIILRPPGGEQ